MKYHLCCGPQKMNGYTNVDRVDFGQEIVANIENEWKWAKPSTAEEIYIKDGFEHLENTELFLERAWKALKVGGKLIIEVPHYKAPSAYRITHKHFFSWSTFNIYPEPHDKIKFKVVKNKLILPGLPGLNWLANRSPKWWEKIFYAEGIHVELVKE